MKGISSALLLTFTFLLAGNAFTAISTTGQPNPITIGSNDVFSLDAVNYFDLKQAVYPLTVKASHGTTITSDQLYDFVLYPDGESKALYMVERLHDNLVAVVYDGANIFFQKVNFDGKSLDKDYVEVEHPGVTGMRLVCTGFAYNKYVDAVHIGCTDETPSSGTKINSFVIFTVDATTGKLYGNQGNVQYIKQDDGFVIENRLEMFIMDLQFSDASKPDTFLIVYD